MSALTKVLCRLFGHDRMKTNSRQRHCLRCGQEEALRRYGGVLAWEEVTDTPLGGATA
jgi:hypothetical protein